MTSDLYYAGILKKQGNSGILMALNGIFWQYSKVYFMKYLL